MPYIEQHRRKPLLECATPQSAGELNYVFTTAAIAYLYDRGKSYQTINDVIGALEAAKQEFYRRMVVPYENEKIEKNGDVF